MAYGGNVAKRGVVYRMAAKSREKRGVIMAAAEKRSGKEIS